LRAFHVDILKLNRRHHANAEGERMTGVVREAQPFRSEWSAPKDEEVRPNSLWSIISGSLLLVFDPVNTSRSVELQQKRWRSKMKSESASLDNTLHQFLEFYATLVQIHFTADRLDKTAIKWQVFPILEAMGLAKQSGDEQNLRLRSTKRLRRRLESMSVRDNSSDDKEGYE
jgi:hypothetical protein